MERGGLLPPDADLPTGKAPSVIRDASLGPKTLMSTNYSGIFETNQVVLTLELRVWLSPRSRL